MKNSAFVIAGILVGCVGATTASLVAQYPANPQAPRWEQFCESGGGEELGARLRTRGAEGWELVGVNYPGSPAWALVCYKRPAP